MGKLLIFYITDDENDYYDNVSKKSHEPRHSFLSTSNRGWNDDGK